MRCVLGDVVLGVHGDAFSYLFSYAQGGPVSLQSGGYEWAYRPPRPTFWRATTCNDRGNGFPARSAMWMGADLFTSVQSIAVQVDGQHLEKFTAPWNNTYRGTALENPKEVCITYTYVTPTTPETTVDVSYTVREEGSIQVRLHYRGEKSLPGLPVFGWRLVTPHAVDGYSYDGLEGETYPDRKAGARTGSFTVEGLPVTPYVVPQDCGVHMDSQRVSLHHGGHGFHVDMDNVPFAFSALPYTALELENASHHEELPPVRRTVLCILGAVRGAGGINSWGADVLPAYHISGEKDIILSFSVSLT